MKNNLYKAAGVLSLAVMLTACGTETSQSDTTQTLQGESVEESTAQTQEAQSEQTQETFATEQENAAEDIITELKAGVALSVDGLQLVLDDIQVDPENEEIKQIIAQYGDQSLEVDQALALDKAYYVQKQGQNYVLVETSTYDDYSIVYVLTLENGAITKTDQVDGSLIQVPAQPDGAFTIESRVNVLGTYGGQLQYNLQDGKMAADGTLYQFLNPVDDYTITLTVAGEISCRLDGGNTTLKAGEVIQPTGYSQDGTFYFQMEDGTAGSFIVDLDGEGQYAGTIDGVSEYDLFENLPYAG